MKVTMTNGEMIQTLNQLGELATREKESGTAKFSARVGFAITKNIKALENLYAPYLETKERLDQKYLTDTCLEEMSKNPMTERVYREDHTEQECFEELKELLDTKNDIDIQAVTFEDIESANNVTLADQQAIFFMIEG